MSIIDLLSDATWVTAISVIISAVATYFATKSRNKTKLAINDRMQLSKDQYQLIFELRKMMQDQKDELDELRGEIKQLQIVNVNLTVQNKHLQAKITELNRKLEYFSKK